MRERLKIFIPWIILLIILSVGAYLRLHEISLYMTFLGDEGRDVLVVKRMIVDHKWTLLGPTASVGGFFMGPIYYYFMLPFLWAFKLNPVGPAVMVALFGIATIYLVFHIGKKIYGENVGFIGAMLYALSPLVIAYSRSSWNPNIVPFFAILLFYILWRVVAKNCWNELFWAGIVLGIGIQLHYTFLFLFVVSFVWLCIYGRDWKHFRHGVYLFIGFLIGFSPFLAFEVRHGFTNTQAIFGFVFAGKDTGFSLFHVFSSAGDVLFRMFGRFLLRIPEEGTLGNLPALQKSAWIIGTWTMAAFSLGSCIAVVVLKKKLQKIFKELTREQERKERLLGFLLLLLWIAIVIICFGFYKKAVYDYYFGIMFFAPFFLIGIFLDIISRRHIGKIIGIVLLVALVLWNWEGRPFKFEPNNQLGQVERIAKEVVEKTDGKPFNFALITTGNSDHAYRYFFEIWGQSPVTIENTSVDPSRTSVTEQLLIVCEDIFCKPLGNSLWEVAGFGRAEIVGQWDVSVVKIYKLVHYQGEESK